MADKVATLVEVKNYFGYANVKEFQADWNQLSGAEQAQIKAGLGNGSLTY